MLQDPFLRTSLDAGGGRRPFDAHEVQEVHEVQEHILRPKSARRGRAAIEI